MSTWLLKTSPSDVMSEDEFDQLPDLFSGIDWNTVPGLSTVPPASRPSASTSGSVPSPVEPRYPTPLAIGRATSSTSTQYSFDEWDASFLDDLNKAEQGLLQKQVAGGLFSREDRGEETSTRSNSRSATTSRYFHELQVARDISSSHFVHRYPSAKSSHEWVNGPNSHAEDSRSDSLPISGSEFKSTKVVHRMSPPPTRGSSPKRHKGKQKESPRGILKEFLNNIEDEIICPICCDIFTFAHLGNPCGHTFCGECGWRWIKKHREAPSCAICRASLSLDVPMIPNFAVDNTVEKHVAALRTSGIEGWESAGTKFKEWQDRKERWKADSTRMKVRKKAPTFSVIVAPYAPRGSSPGGSAYVGEDTRSSGDGSSHSGSPEVEREPTNRRRGHNNHHHDNHHRRSRGNRRNRVAVGRHDSRGEPAPRARRSRRRRRD